MAKYLLFACLFSLSFVHSIPLRADPPGARPYTLFESGQVRPLAMSPNGLHLYAVNTPDNQLEVFRIRLTGLEHIASIPVGLEPVAVAARSNDEVWVVNHLSDSVSIVDVTLPIRGRVVRTLLVGDEPRDIVFARANKSRAFITTAHRGQNNPNDPQLTTPGVGRADVWVFDAQNPGTTLGGSPLNIITLFTDTPRALAVSKDGTRVYAAGFMSGNQTTIVHEEAVLANGGSPPPLTNANLDPQPPKSLIVRHNGTNWVDELARTWDNFVMFSLPDKDVFVIDAMANPPAQLSGTPGYFQGVGTVLYNMAVNPVSGRIYVSNTEAFNERRFEGEGLFSGHSVRGQFAENRITVIDPATRVITPRHLNTHIDYNSCCAPVPNAEGAKSLALPTEMAVSSNGSKLYVAAMGSSKIGIYDTAQLENGTFVPSLSNQVALTGGGPTGVVLDEARNRLYVLTRFDNSISIVNTTTKTETHHIAMHNPEPASILQGRRFLYDAAFTSSRGDSACATCHVFGDFDGLSWDLGDPDVPTVLNPGPFAFDPVLFGLPPATFASLKGPMSTQSLRGMANHGPMHWRGDRTGGLYEPSAQPDEGTFDEEEAFRQFRVAFAGLLGRDGPISESDMQAFTDFALQITYPPNPIRNLDNSLTPDQQIGHDFFFTSPSTGGQTCNFCHTTDRLFNAQYGVAIPGAFGTAGLYTFDGQEEELKIPHLRNQYQKVGMFGHAPHPGVEPGNNQFMGDQIRGFGFLYDGSDDTIFRFHQRVGFSLDQSPGGFPTGPAGVPLRRQVENFILAFDSNLFPIAGQQITLTTTNGAVVGPRISLLKARAEQQECDLVVKGFRQGRIEGFLYANGMFQRDTTGRPAVTDAVLRASVHLPFTHEMTYTCVPPGAGMRMALDRDLDGALDGDEIQAGTDPADPGDFPT